MPAVMSKSKVLKSMSNNNMKEITLTVTIDEANLILEGLGNLPFAKVFALVAKLQEQAKQQLGNADQAAPASNEAESPMPAIKE